MGYIYKITNQINNKIYIGKTVKSIERRFWEHKNNAHKNVNLPLYKAINKYGEDNFNIEIVETVENNNCLNEREIYWINYFNSYIDKGHGYNCTHGGDGGNTNSEKTHDYDQDVISLWEQGLTYNQINEKLGLNCSHSVFTRILLKAGYTSEDIHYHQYQNWNKAIIAKTSKKVQQFTLNGDFIAEYPSISEASRQTGCAPQNIINICKGVTRFPRKFLWKYVE